MTVDEIERPTVKPPIMAADLERMLINEQQQKQQRINQTSSMPPPSMMRPPWITPEMHAAMLGKNVSFHHTIH